jgi:putative glycosyltransferase
VAATHELIFVDDGSPDDSLRLALAICARDPRVSVVELSRNFGHHRAMMTGLARARGNLVFLIDSDLEEQPEWLEEFAERLRAADADVIYGVQQRRKGSWFERVTGYLFYRLFNALSEVPMPQNVSTVRLMRRPYVRNLVAHRDREMFIAGLWALTGFRQVPVPVAKTSTSPTTYTLRRRIANFLDAATSLSRRPLVLVFYLGLFVVLMSSAGVLYLVYQRIVSGFLPGWTSLIVSVWMLGGLTLFSIGLIGLYLSRIFIETKRRPYTVVRQVYRQSTLAHSETPRA